jgi:hypothetical protein
MVLSGTATTRATHGNADNSFRSQRIAQASILAAHPAHGTTEEEQGPVNPWRKGSAWLHRQNPRLQDLCQPHRDQAGSDHLDCVLE